MIRTDDIFLGAFALSRGGELHDIAVSSVNGRRVAFFTIEGADPDQTQRDYYQGPATVDLQRLKAAVRRLKDAAFDSIREEERRHAGDERGNRAYQGLEQPGRRRL